MVLSAAGLILLFFLLMMYISNGMEFVFVESLVTNVVSFWTYTRKSLDVGFDLFMIRIGLLVAFVILLVIGMLPEYSRLPAFQVVSGYITYMVISPGRPVWQFM